MKNKKLFVLSLTASLMISSLWAADYLTSVPGGAMGDASKTVPGSRWQFSRTVSVTNVSTSAQFYTNIVTTLPSLVGKIVWVPGHVGDAFEIHTCTTAATVGTANEIFVQNSVTNSSLNGPLAGYPQVYNFELSSLDATNGIVTVIKPANTSVVSRVFLIFDKNR